MGYYCDIWGEEFFIAKENLHSAWDAVKKSSLPEDWKKGNSMEEIFQNCGFEVRKTESGDIDRIHITEYYIKLTDPLEIFFKIIAPYVKKGSYLQMHGEDNSLWEWSFEDDEMKENPGTAIFG